MSEDCCRRNGCWQAINSVTLRNRPNTDVSNMIPLVLLLLSLQDNRELVPVQLVFI